MLELGELVPAAQYVQGQRARSVIRERVRSAFDANRLDCMIGPTLPTTSPLLDEHKVSLTGESEESLSSFLHHCFLGNVIGIPALSFPCGFDAKGLPIGFQLYGRPLTEATLFRIAHAYEQVTSWTESRPQPERLLMEAR